MPSVMALNSAVGAHAQTHTHACAKTQYMHSLTSTHRANEQLPAAQTVTAVERDNVNIN